MKSGDLRHFLESRRTLLVCLLLAAVTLAVYGQVARFEFTNYDESVTILKNPIVFGGLTWPGFCWALTTSWFDYWHPLTWLSHMLDCEVFGLNAGWHHLVNLGFHVADALLLLAVLRRMTGALWRSAMVAALFALHPLHVQSVAWIAERKDVLSAFFFMLTLWAYGRYAEVRSPKSEVRSQQPGPEGQGAISGITQHPTRDSQGSSRITHHVSRFTLHASRFYLLSLLFFACGLMSKPMVVTLPFVLLLLDYWPLRRLEIQSPKSKVQSQHPASTLTPQSQMANALFRLLLEKLPFFALTLASCVLAWLNVKAASNNALAETVPWGLRLANVPVSYARYLGKTIWPADLAALYPMPSHWAGWQVGGALVVLVLCSLLAAALVRRQPWLTVGWLWFLGMLVPVIALVPVWHISIADRYTYLPLVGLFLALVWGGFELLRILRAPGTVGWPVAGVIVLACAVGSWAQARYWRNSEALWARALAVTTRNAGAYHNYGFVLEQRGRLQEAVRQYEEALRIEPNMYETQNNLGRVLYQLGRLREATNHLMQAVRIGPGDRMAHANLGEALVALGDWGAAREQYEAAMAADPRNPTIPSAWGKALLARNQASEALEHFAQALQLDPTFAEARLGCAFALAQRGAALAAQGNLNEAVQDYRDALRLQGDLPEVLNNLAWLLATAKDQGLRSGDEAVRFAKRACELSRYQQAMFVGTLAAAYAEDGQFEEARVMAQKAIAVAEASGQSELVARNRELLQLYEAGKPYRQ